MYGCKKSPSKIQPSLLLPNNGQAGALQNPQAMHKGNSPLLLLQPCSLAATKKLCPNMEVPLIMYRIYCINNNLYNNLVRKAIQVKINQEQYNSVHLYPFFKNVKLKGKYCLKHSTLNENRFHEQPIS